MTAVSAWGRLSKHEHAVIPLADRTQVTACLAGPGPGLAHGMGRSYGDVCLNPHGRLWDTTGLDRFIAFDPGSGRLRCESGVLLRDIQRITLPHGWMLPVTPGTQLVTVGGAIANDVHGKNHHRFGTFGDHLERLTLARTDGRIIECDRAGQPDLFAATVGGLGLTGVIVQAELQLRRAPGPWLDIETIPYAGLPEFFALAQASEAGWEHTVSWIDCVAGAGGRGLFMRANPIDLAGQSPSRDRAFGVPVAPPVSMVNRWTLRPFNAAYYHLGKRRRGRATAHYERFLYPLDNVRDWNRLYGPRGFFQYQAVVPHESGPSAIQAMLDEIGRSRDGSFLAVLKTFGDRAPAGMLSFPRPGVTLALDFPNGGARTHALFARLDAILRDAGGRIYPAKDARMPQDLFESGYPRLGEFLPHRDPGISSGFSRRLLGS